LLLLLRSFRAALAMTGCTPLAPRRGVAIVARNVVSIGPLESERRLALAASVVPTSA
jgi:hypothetical protein